MYLQTLFGLSFVAATVVAQVPWNFLVDIKNCGKRGNVCATRFQNAHPGCRCDSGNCRPIQCLDGYEWDVKYNRCVDITSDSQNCGRCGQTCSFQNGSGKCLNRKCVYTSCSRGYTLVNGVCTYVNLQEDEDNCGAIGNKCPSAYGYPLCKNGVCGYSGCKSSCRPRGANCEPIDFQNDPENCGTVGNVCPSQYANGGSGVCKSGQCQTTCKTSFSWCSRTRACIDTSRDINNCGSIGKVCPSPTGGTAQCVNGRCSVASCDNTKGYYLVNGSCVKVNTGSDVNNCGSIGNKCPFSYPNGVGSICVNGQCQARVCNTGCGWSFNQRGCINTQTDVNNCGSVGNVCTVPNGTPQCQFGRCNIQRCNNGFWPQNGVCVGLDLTCNVNHCGRVGNVCPSTNGTPQCRNSVCSYSSCKSPLILRDGQCIGIDYNTDPKNCGGRGKCCPPRYINGGVGVCVNGRCTTNCNDGYDFDFFWGTCRPITSDSGNCGRCGNVCGPNNPPNSTSRICRNRQCWATACQAGYRLKDGKCTRDCDTENDTENCGGVGNVCDFGPPGSAGVCQKGRCVVTKCPPKYNLINGKCVSCGPSQRAKVKRSEEPSLCPAGEMACPIMGSASFELARAYHFTTAADFSTILGGSGGYECLDVSQSLESCGGCVSTGEGEDCTRIRGAVGVGCEVGKCVVFSCHAGWKPDSTGKKCIRALGDDELNNLAARHVAGRHSSRF